MLKGKWFKGRLCGLCAVGWEWVTIAALAKIFMGENSESRFPISPKCKVLKPENLEFDVDDLNIFQSFGTYFQAIGEIKIGKGTYIGPNCGLITANHNHLKLEEHLPPESIEIGKCCWIGMNSVILPGVVIGDHTIVGAGAVVKDSFKDGYCVIAGNPAKIVKKYYKEEFKK